MQHKTPIRLGGPGCVVQIDESLFRHKPKVYNTMMSFVHNSNRFHTQHHRGRATTQEQWVFGLVDVSQEPSLGYMEMVSRRDAQTLLPIIQAHVLPGTTIYSDQWAAYNQVQSIPNVAAHATVNHSLHFVDLQTGVRTQNIESYWNRVKYRFKHMKGVHLHQLASHLDEFMWRESHGQTTSLAFENIMRDISAQYPV